MIVMKWLSLILIGYLVPACFAEILVQEDFEGTTFPPAGWTTDSAGYGQWSANWIRGVSYGNHYAQGSCSFFYAFSGARTFLYTPYFSLAAGTALTISYNGGVDDGSGSTSSFFLWDSKTTRWTGLIPMMEDDKPEKRSLETTPVPESGTYRIAWMAWCDQNPYYPAMGMMVWVDNVRVTTFLKCTSDIEPTSLGRIKSAYK
jgi:hypothetical protein